MITPALLADRDSYERTMEGWCDNTHDDAFTHTVRLEDPFRALEVEVVAEPSPTYAIRAAGLRPLHGEIASSVVAGFATLAGTAMVGGFTRRVAEVTGEAAGGALTVDAAIEVARLARQVAKLPRPLAERAVGNAREAWHLDTAGWIDLPDSCFTYSAAGRALLETRAVSTPIQADIYSARPDQRRIFVRRKRARLARSGDRLALFHAMHDNVHGFELT